MLCFIPEIQNAVMYYYGLVNFTVLLKDSTAVGDVIIVYCNFGQHRFLQCFS